MVWWLNPDRNHGTVTLPILYYLLLTPNVRVLYIREADEIDIMPSVNHLSWLKE